MPRTSAAKKAMRQNERRRMRRRASSRYMKTMIRKLADTASGGNKEQAKSLLPVVFSAIDRNVKKNLLHWRTAARKKSTLAKLCQ